MAPEESPAPAAGGEPGKARATEGVTRCKRGNGVAVDADEPAPICEAVDAWEAGSIEMTRPEVSERV